MNIWVIGFSIFGVVMAMIFYGTKKEIPYINYKEPLGRLMFFLMNSIAYGCLYASSVFEGPRAPVSGSPLDNLVIWCFLIFAGLFLAMLGGMRRLSDIGTPPPWVYPIIFVVGILVSFYTMIGLELMRMFVIGMMFVPGKHQEQKKETDEDGDISKDDKSAGVNVGSTSEKR